MPWERSYSATNDMWELGSPFHGEAVEATRKQFAAFKREGFEPGPGVFADVVQRRVYLAHNHRGDLPAVTGRPNGQINA